MSLLYINENGTIIGVEGNRFIVRYKDGMIKSTSRNFGEYHCFRNSTDYNSVYGRMFEKRDSYFLLFKRWKIFWKNHVYWSYKSWITTWGIRENFDQEDIILI